ncbi:MAG TPA: FHA domain-containing protein [Gemmatimonadales bacterium]|nr:FHA domain-containing protein [Gemmatimonadales bacterium]
MTPRLAILSGGRAGEVQSLQGAAASIGRHPTCQVRIDADQDSAVSNRHAIVQQKDGVWVLRDLGSLHGTYLKGQRISEEQPLNDGDVFRLGAAGPELQFLLSERAEVAAPSSAPTEAQPGKPVLSAEQVARILEEEQAGQQARDLAAQERKQRLIKIVAAVAGAVLVVALALYLWRSHAARQAADEAHRRQLLRADSLMASVASLSVSLPPMRASLDSAREAALRLRTALETAGADPAAAAPIVAGLDSVIRREQDIAAAAAFDPAAVARPSVPAVGLVVAQYADGSTALATCFAVRRDGTGGILLTTRQVVLNADGDTPVQLMVLMPGVAQPITARVLGTHQVEDIALLRVQQRGGIPVVQGLAWREPPVGSGKPVALLGFAPPIQAPADGDWRRATVASTAVTGTAARVSPGFITVDGWSAPVGAGTPVIDGEGLVAGLISTAAPSAGGRLYDAVPVKFALELLDRLQ